MIITATISILCPVMLTSSTISNWLCTYEAFPRPDPNESLMLLFFRGILLLSGTHLSTFEAFDVVMNTVTDIKLGPK